MLLAAKGSKTVCGMRTLAGEALSKLAASNDGSRRPEEPRRPWPIGRV
jgi:hypothetical protein